MPATLDAFRKGRGPCRVGVVVAHPDDETLWAGGLLLSRPEWSLTIVTLCRGEDPDRAPRFRRALAAFQAEGAMGVLDDGPGQEPLADAQVQGAILALLPQGSYDLLLTHGPEGEYTRHRRHLETARAVRALLRQGALAAGQLWHFAYEDQGGARLPLARPDATFRLPLDELLWAQKYRLVTEVYGFRPDSWEARAAPRTEAFTRPPDEDWKPR